MKISIIIPAYNEEKRIVKTIQKITEYMSNKFSDYEIIVVNDGSKDNTIKVVEDLNLEKVKVLNNPGNRGKGYAVRNGMLNSEGDIRLFSDADLATPIEELEKFMPYFSNGYDVVIGSRALKESNIEKHQPFYREMMGKTFNFLVQRLTIKGIKDTQCGFKAFTKEAAQKVFEKSLIDGFSFDVESLYIANKLGFKIKELPVTWINDEATKVNAIKDSIKMFKDILKIRKLHKKTFR